jgi:hypothetical protein
MTGSGRHRLRQASLISPIDLQSSAKQGIRLPPPRSRAGSAGVPRYVTTPSATTEVSCNSLPPPRHRAVARPAEPRGTEGGRAGRSGTVERQDVGGGRRQARPGGTVARAGLLPHSSRHSTVPAELGPPRDASPKPETAPQRWGLRPARVTKGRRSSK